MSENKVAENTFIQGVKACASMFTLKAVESARLQPEVRSVMIMLLPLRGFYSSLLAVLPFVVIGLLSRLDIFYFQLLVPFIFWGMLEKMTHKHRLNAFAKCCEALGQPEKAAQIMHSGEAVPLTAGGVSSLTMLICCKLMVLYFLAGKHLIASDSPGNIQFLIMLVAIPVLSELGVALILSGDDKSAKEKKPIWPVLAALVFALPFGAGLWFLASPNTLIMPLSLVLLMVFYWKHKADTVFSGSADCVAGACYESCELAAALGMLIVYQDPFNKLLLNLFGIFGRA